MLFSWRKYNTSGCVSHIDGINLEEVKTTKFLGVIMDNDMRWEEHIKYVEKKNSFWSLCTEFPKTYFNIEALDHIVFHTHTFTS